VAATNPNEALIVQLGRQRLSRLLLEPEPSRHCINGGPALRVVANLLVKGLQKARERRVGIGCYYSGWPDTSASPSSPTT
jgi:hypothetical protein